jgi:hypothetical protein
MVVNSALTFLREGQVRTYVMNQAAVPAEAFDPAYPTDPGLEQNARDYGYPDDGRWERGWQEMISNRSVPADLARCGQATTERDCWSAYDHWREVAGPDKSEAELRVAFTQRWRQVRPTPWVPEQPPSGAAPSRGPWRGIFAANLDKARIVNVFAANDFVLGSLWRLNQRLQKPNFGPFGVLPQVAYSTYWGRLDNSSANEQVVFPTQSPTRASIVREWAELAHWFPSTSVTAGTVPLFEAPLQLTGRVPGGALNPLISHSYLHMLPLTSAWPVFADVVNALHRR